MGEYYTKDTFKCGICRHESFVIEDYVSHMICVEKCEVVLHPSKILCNLGLPRFTIASKTGRDVTASHGSDVFKAADAVQIYSENSVPSVRWKCRLCGLSFSRRAAFLNHLTLIHSYDNSNKKNLFLGYSSETDAKSSSLLAINDNADSLAEHATQAAIVTENCLESNTKNYFSIKAHSSDSTSVVTNVVDTEREDIVSEVSLTDDDRVAKIIHHSGQYTSSTEKKPRFDSSVSDLFVCREDAARDKESNNYIESSEITEIDQPDIVDLELDVNKEVDANDDSISVYEAGSIYCKICSETFKTSRTLQQHLNVVHTLQKPFICPFPDCGQAFKTKGSMLRHKGRHTGERPYECGLCGRSFRELRTLVRHKQAVISCINRTVPLIRSAAASSPSVGLDSKVLFAKLLKKEEVLCGDDSRGSLGGSSTPSLLIRHASDNHACNSASEFVDAVHPDGNDTTESQTKSHSNQVRAIKLERKDVLFHQARCCEDVEPATVVDDHANMECMESDCSVFPFESSRVKIEAGTKQSRCKVEPDQDGIEHLPSEDEEEEDCHCDALNSPGSFPPASPGSVLSWNPSLVDVPPYGQSWLAEEDSCVPRSSPDCRDVKPRLIPVLADVKPRLLSAVCNSPLATDVKPRLIASSSAAATKINVRTRSFSEDSSEQSEGIEKKTVPVNCQKSCKGVAAFVDRRDALPPHANFGGSDQPVLNKNINLTKEQVLTSLRIPLMSSRQDKTNKCTTVKSGKTVDDFVVLFTCPLCSSSFNVRSSLMIHLHSHTDKLGPKCCECNKSFITRQGVVRHLARHASLRRLVCPECEQLFSHRSQLQQHRLYHSQLKTVACDDCEKTFKSVSARNLHARSAHSGQREECGVCGGIFSTRSSLLRHQRVHSGVRPYACPHCSTAFRDKGSLSRHLKHKKPCCLINKSQTQPKTVSTSGSVPIGNAASIVEVPSAGAASIVEVLSAGATRIVEVPSTGAASIVQVRSSRSDSIVQRKPNMNTRRNERVSSGNNIRDEDSRDSHVDSQFIIDSHSSLDGTPENSLVAHDVPTLTVSTNSDADIIVVDQSNRERFVDLHQSIFEADIEPENELQPTNASHFAVDAVRLPTDVANLSFMEIGHFEPSRNFSDDRYSSSMGQELLNFSYVSDLPTLHQNYQIENGIHFIDNRESDLASSSALETGGQENWSSHQVTAALQHLPTENIAVFVPSNRVNEDVHAHQNDAEQIIYIQSFE